MAAASRDRDILRALRRLAAKNARLAEADGVHHIAYPGGANDVDAATAGALVARGLVATDGVLTDAGRALLRRMLATADEFPAQHQDRAIALVTDEAGSHAVVVNHDESPLAWLRRRRDRDGRPLVDAIEFAAGERLRADYSRGRIMPRVTANWTAAVAGRGRDGGGSVAELTEVAIGARRRVEKALEAVGPELGGLLVDFCCFLKGLEEIERERQWPARSAKVALRLGLAALARHYGLLREARGKARPTGTLHWGTEDYRPTIG